MSAKIWGGGKEREVTGKVILYLKPAPLPCMACGTGGDEKRKLVVLTKALSCETPTALEPCSVDTQVRSQLMESSTVYYA
jgi:hypothetical protein